MLSSLKTLQKLCRPFADSLYASREISTFMEPLRIQMTTPLCAEPLKKKKKLDPQIIKQREERKRKRLEKQIRRLEKNAKQLKPIEECEIPMEILNEKSSRARPSPKLTREELNGRASLIKEWSLYRYRQNLNDAQMIDRIVLSQQWALDQLRAESEELYQAAVTPDEGLMPFIATGPVETPPIQNYDSPDGEFVDVSKKWDVSPSDLLGKSKRRI
uniref:Large ribosomal subunit protein mL40 n=1 Tax=Lygus hesperus TaxID=30085 RepID=A0A0K8SNV1_LYGHE